MLSLFRTQTPAIGLDVGSESIKLLQLATTVGGVKVVAARRVMIPADVKGDPDRRVAFAGETVRCALRSGAFVGRRVIAAVPKELLHYKTHRLPPMAADEVCMAGRIDARDLFRFDPDSTDYQCIDAGEIDADRRREVILIAAGRKYLDQFVHALHGAGALVTSLDIDPCALWRAALRFEPNNAEDARVLLDLGAAQSRLVIGQRGQIRLVKTIDAGGDHLRNAIVRKLGLSPAEVDQLRRRCAGASEDKKLEGFRAALADATQHVTQFLAQVVAASIRYHAATFRDPPVRHVELLGGAAADAYVASTLALTLQLPVRPVDPLRGIDNASVSTADQSAYLGEWAVALGLALKGFADPLPAVIAQSQTDATSVTQPPTRAAALAASGARS